MPEFTRRTGKKAAVAYWSRTTKQERFWANVDKSGECWVRRGSKEGCYDGERHRTAWVLTHGPIPDGLQVLHKCDNKRCTRPDHLFLGTQQDNMRDMIQKGRWAKIRNTNQKGENNNAARLNREQVIKAKQMLAAGHRQADVMRATGITRANVWCIAHGESWVDVIP